MYFAPRTHEAKTHCLCRFLLHYPSSWSSHSSLERRRLRNEIFRLMNTTAPNQVSALRAANAVEAVPSENLLGSLTSPLLQKENRLSKIFIKFVQ